MVFKSSSHHNSPISIPITVLEVTADEIFLQNIKFCRSNLFCWGYLLALYDNDSYIFYHVSCHFDYNHNLDYSTSWQTNYTFSRDTCTICMNWRYAVDESVITIEFHITPYSPVTWMCAWIHIFVNIGHIYLCSYKLLTGGICRFKRAVYFQ